MRLSREGCGVRERPAVPASRQASIGIGGTMRLFAQGVRRFDPVTADMSSPDRRRSLTRPTREQYFMLLAVASRERAACLGRHVGAILVADQRIIATGYNGTPTGFPNCDEGGCHRCSHPESYAEGRGYDVCICVHAEQNALLQAAKIGYSVQGSHCYSTLRPCFGCLKELYQAGVTAIRYLNEWTPSDPVEQQAYDALLGELAGRSVVVAQLELPEA